MTDELKEEIKKYIVNLIKEYKGKKRFKPLEIEKDVAGMYADKGVTRRDVKNIIKELTEEGTLIYGYAGSSFLALPEEQQEEIDKKG